MGRDARYDADHLRKLKSQDFGNGKITIYTYDDLLNGLASLIHRTKECKPKVIVLDYFFSWCVHAYCRVRVGSKR
jgi:hypothetical protein